MRRGEGLATGADCSPPCQQVRGPRTAGGRKPALPRSRAPGRPHGRAPARSFRPVRALEFCLPARPPPDFKGGVREALRGLIRRPGFRKRDRRRHDRPGPPQGTGAKGGQIGPLALVPSLPKVAGRPDRQDRRHGRRAWQSPRLRCSARPAPRQRRRGAANRRDRDRRSARRYGLRQRLAARRARSAGRPRRHPAEGRPCPPDFRRFRHLQTASPNGVVSPNASSAIVPSSGASPPATKKTDASDPAAIHLAATRFALECMSTDPSA